MNLNIEHVSKLNEECDHCCCTHSALLSIGLSGLKKRRYEYRGCEFGLVTQVLR